MSNTITTPAPSSAPPDTSAAHKLTVWAIIIGTVLEALSAVLHQLATASVVDPSAHWYVVVLAVIGVVLQIASLLGYHSTTAKVLAAHSTAQAIAAQAVPTKPSAQ